MEKRVKFIASIPLFSGLADQEAREICAISVEKRYVRGETIFVEGDEGSGFYVVAHGKVKVFKLSLEGKEHILHIYGPGHPIGEVPVFSGSRFPANAQALINSRLLFFPRKAFAELIARNPSVSMNMLAVLSRRLRAFTVQIENLALKEVPGRLASYLIYLSQEQAADQIVRLAISKGQLASLLGTVPETLSRIFAKMSAQGLIAVQGAQIHLLDKGGIEALADYGKLAE